MEVTEQVSRARTYPGPWRDPQRLAPFSAPRTGLNAPTAHHEVHQVHKDHEVFPRRIFVTFVVFVAFLAKPWAGDRECAYTQ